MMPLELLWTIQLAPLAAFILIQLLPRPVKPIAPALGILFSLGAAVSSLLLFWQFRDSSLLPVQFATRWLSVSQGYSLSVGFLIDPLNLLMICLVTTISFFVQIFSYYYMAEDASRARYFAFLSFFSFSMTGLVLSSNLLQTFIFWELVGLTSYLLIGFWYEKKSASDAARKAFVINRLADLGFYLGIILLFLGLGTVGFLDLKTSLLKSSFSEPMLTVLALLVFTGVMGKSAQFPFHVWLPDAMEGPTPVSALIHSATMVAAGVFLLARNFALFSSSEMALSCILGIGTLTALTGALLATSQNDIKKILAYSTVSQLGLMTMAIGAGSSLAGIFHLSTHAYFKSLLFLTSGAFIHRFHSNDIWEIGKKGGKMDGLALAMLAVGLLSLCGVFPFAGFFSKDLLLEAIKEKSVGYYAAACLVSLLTVYYSCRLLFVILFSKIQHAEHAHSESALRGLCRTLPLLSLFIISLGVGALGTGLLGHRLLFWLGASHAPHFNLEIFLTTLGLLLGGSLTAYFLYRNPATAFVRDGKKNVWTTTLENKFYIDEAYSFLVKQIGLRVAAVLNWFDKAFVSGVMVDRTSYGILGLGRLLSKAQNGLLQDYLSIGIAVGAFVIFWLVYSSRGSLG